MIRFDGMLPHMESGHQSVLKKLLLCTPAGVAAGPWRGMGLALSFAVHIAGLGLFGAVILLAYPDTRPYLVDGGLDDLAMYMMALLATFLLVELVHLLLALLTVCWGAGVEPWRASMGRTLSRWYQLTPWLAIWVLGFIGAMEGIDELDTLYWDTYYNRGPAGTYVALEEGRFWFLIQCLRSATVSLFFGGGLWLVLPTLAVHRDRPRWFASCRWPAVCAGCGYALAGLTDEQACPECGSPVAASKHTDRGPIKTPAWKLIFTALLQPTKLGQQILTRRHTGKPLRVLLIALLAVVATGPMGLFLVQTAESIQWGDEWSSSFGEFVEEIIVMGTMAGVLMMVAAALIALGVGSVNATSARVFGKRNAMVASRKAACLSSGILPVWSVLNFALIATIIVVVDMLDTLRSGSWEIVIPFAILGFHMGMLVLYMILVGRMERAARYANE